MWVPPTSAVNSNAFDFRHKCFSHTDMTVSIKKKSLHSANSLPCFFYRALRLWRRGNIALITTPPLLDCLNSVQHLHPRCLEDRFLRKQTKAQSLQHIISHLLAVLRLPGSVHLLTKKNPTKDDSSALSVPAPHHQRNFPQACLDCLAPQRPGTGSSLCAHLPH